MKNQISSVNILLSNDDGYRAEGLRHLIVAVRPLADVTVVAPDRNRRGASNSLTLDVPLRVFSFGERSYFVNGTPTDCVHLAISGLFDFDHDMVVSGINDGPNLGDDVLYSGTVAAAVEGRFLGLPAIAISLAIQGNYSDLLLTGVTGPICRTRRSRATSRHVLAIVIGPNASCPRRIHAAGRCIGSGQQGWVRMRGQARTSTRSPTVMCP